MSKQSDTPRTDKFYASFADGECIPNQDEWLALCQSLESQLTAARAELSEKEDCIYNCMKEAMKFKEQRDRLIEVVQSRDADRAYHDQQWNNLREQRDRLAEEALDRIARPIWWMQEDQKRATGSINGINGAMAVSLSESASYLKGIATEALQSLTTNEPSPSVGVNE